jgi:5-(carboxyamino)imidazole ribonucleotide synthase
LEPLKIGILGGGQLGRMLLQSAANYHVETYVLESGKNPPASALCHYFIEGDIRDYHTVYAFGKKVDVLTIEIENVNVEALLNSNQKGCASYQNLLYFKPSKTKDCKRISIVLIISRPLTIS